MISKEAPFICFGILSMIGGVLTITFPETLGTRLPDTIEQAEDVKLNRHLKIKLNTTVQSS